MRYVDSPMCDTVRGALPKVLLVLYTCIKMHYKVEAIITVYFGLVQSCSKRFLS